VANNTESRAELISSGEAARILGISKDTVRDWSLGGALTFQWAGGNRVFRRGEIEDLAKLRKMRGQQ
jgi:DNA-binding transcriptional MerR regulator